MYDQAPDINCEWKETAKGNHVCIHSDEIAATVFNKGYGWQIIINRNGVGHIAAGEIYDDPEDAQERAEWILSGANCTLFSMGSGSQAKPTTTNWKRLSRTSNGSPTYGRTYNDMGVSVKKASNDNWFYITYSDSIRSKPDGWSPTAEKAMKAFDAKHP